MLKRKTILSAVLLVLVGLLGGCGDDDAPPGEETMDREPGTSVEEG
ncbi:hypothetical protein [Modicisalibacter xianhensis]|uniref:Uncharacterized protein n=1 Tax=Modicisalibacter xianhensis TaxID=442341 RepID=A0A1I3EYU9_9GAMM|nr:hypothetical protein [Halomonas xianhensis]SFI03751.1 hypothetical protein SAMN04487959_11551 [Halomonas xianhensis]